jgi:hypothetical protein
MPSEIPLLRTTLAKHAADEGSTVSIFAAFQLFNSNLQAKIPMDDLSLVFES